jgi:NAD-dependent SIR2 family protein deacetylase
MPLMRIPYTSPLPQPVIFPPHASDISGAVDALINFLTSKRTLENKKTVILSGAGISVASGLADYRGSNGTYTLNKTYRPIYYGEFCGSHAARRRYWARSFLGWPTLHRSQPNPAHHAVARLGEMGLLSTVITQNVDSFHPQAHPTLRTLELHGYLRRTVCITCRTEYDREKFQTDLKQLNPNWASFLEEMIANGAFTTEDPAERRKRGLKTNPDGDVDVPGVDYSTFRYPPCPKCLAGGVATDQGKEVRTDDDGAWEPPADGMASKAAGILKPAVIMFGESIPNDVKVAVENAVDDAQQILILGSSLATYSAWRLVKRAKDQGKPIAIVNLGGARGEEQFFTDIPTDNDGTAGLRCSLPLEKTLPALVERLEQARSSTGDRLTRGFVPAPWA